MNEICSQSNIMDVQKSGGGSFCIATVAKVTSWT